MTKEGTIMIFLPESIERILERLGRAYESSTKKQRFEEFKSSLENGTSPLLVCEEGKEDEAKLRLMYAVWEWYENIGRDGVRLVENDVYIQRGLKTRVKMLCICNEYKTQKDKALDLLNFINTAHYSSFGQDDEHCKIKDLRLVESEEEFEKILNKVKGVEELTASNAIIRVALVLIDRETIFRKKGIWEDYKRFLKDHLCDDWRFGDALEMFDLWHDVRETAIYYIYVPKVKE